MKKQAKIQVVKSGSRIKNGWNLAVKRRDAWNSLVKNWSIC